MKTLLTILLICSCTLANAQSSALKYIEKYKDDAIEKMNKHGVPASLILGIAMHESANGTSKLAIYLNNHFGLKGKNNSTQIKSAYKGFESVNASYESFITTLKKNRHLNKFFTQVSEYDYQSWVFGVQRGGYAADPAWAKRVIATIKKYKLYEFDTPVAQKELTNNPAEALKPVPEAPEEKTYVVKKGDTLNGIAKKTGTSAKNIQQKNGLKSSLLHPGQKLKI